MANKTREELKQIWTTGSLITEEMFDDLFDSMYVKLSEEWVVKNESTGDGIRIMDDSSLRAISGATLWDDLRVSLETTTTDGANPPDIVFYKNQGSATETSNSIHFLKTYGSGILTIPNDVFYDFTGETSLEFWFFADNLLNSWQELFEKQDIFKIRTNTNNRITLDSQIGYTNSPENTFIRNDWNHIVITYSGTGGIGQDTYKVYVNNVLCITQVGWGPTNNNTNDLKFNEDIAIWKLDNVALWQKEMTTGEVSTSYNSGSGRDYSGLETNLLGLWKMNETSGSIISDSTSNGNDGSIDGIESEHFSWGEGLVNSIVGTIGTRVYSFPHTENREVFFSIQMPHKWVLGSGIHPHLHFVAFNSVINKRAIFKLEYTVAKVFGVFPETTTITSNESFHSSDITKDEHNIYTFPEIDMTGNGVSTMILFRLYRDVDDINDTLEDSIGLLEFDLHYQIDGDGSNNQWVKD